MFLDIVRYFTYAQGGKTDGTDGSNFLFIGTDAAGINDRDPACGEGVF